MEELWADPAKYATMGDPSRFKSPYVDFDAVLSILNRNKAKPGYFLTGMDWDKLQDILKVMEANRMRAWLLPEDVAEHFNKSLQYQPWIGSNKYVRPVMRFLHAGNRIYKSWTLGLYPKYHVRNELTNLWMMYAYADVHDPGLLFTAQKLIDGELTQFGEYTRQQILRLAHEHGVFYEGQFGGDIEREFMRPGIGRTAWNKISTGWGATDKGMEVGQLFENHARLTLFIDGLEKGMSPEAAALRVQKFLFDYTEMSPFERSVLKLAIPFYAFSRKNLPLQIEMLAQRPWAQALPDKLQRSIQYGINEELTPQEESLLSPRIRDAWPIKWKFGDKTVISSLGTWNPIQELRDISMVPKGQESEVGPLKDLRGPFTYLFSRAHPLLTRPLELIMNYSWWYGDKIQKQPGQVERWLGNFWLSPLQIYGLNTFRPLSEMDQMFTVKTWEEKEDKVVSAMRRYVNFMGGNAKVYDLNQLRQWELYRLQKEMEQAQRQYIKQLTIEGREERGEAPQMFGGKPSEKTKKRIDDLMIRAGWLMEPGAVEVPANQ